MASLIRGLAAVLALAAATVGGLSSPAAAEPCVDWDVPTEVQLGRAVPVAFTTRPPLTAAPKVTATSPDGVEVAVAVAASQPGRFEGAFDPGNAGEWTVRVASIPELTGCAEARRVQVGERAAVRPTATSTVADAPSSSAWVYVAAAAIVVGGVVAAWLLNRRPRRL